MRVTFLGLVLVIPAVLCLRLVPCGASIGSSGWSIPHLRYDGSASTPCLSSKCFFKSYFLPKVVPQYSHAYLVPTFETRPVVATLQIVPLLVVTQFGSVARTEGLTITSGIKIVGFL